LFADSDLFDEHVLIESEFDTTEEYEAERGQFCSIKRDLEDLVVEGEMSSIVQGG